MQSSSCNASTANILVVGNPEESYMSELDRLQELGDKVRIVGFASSPDDAESGSWEGVNVMFNCTGNKHVMPGFLAKLPNLKWIHGIFAGLDHFLCDEIVSSDDLVVTNAKGVYSHSLAEYNMFAYSYFAKEFPRLQQQQKDHHWEKFPIKELRGATMGLLGFGDIAKACARLARAYGMRIIALRRRREIEEKEEEASLVDQVYYQEDIHTFFGASDYVTITLPHTAQTENMVNMDILNSAKEGQVLVNLGRGAVIDEEALRVHLDRQDPNCPRRLRGAALDVFATEPLPSSSPLWDIENVLVSPHTVDITTFCLADSASLFVDNVKHFVEGEELINVVDKAAGY